MSTNAVLPIIVLMLAVTTIILGVGNIFQSLEIADLRDRVETLEDDR